jgi:hypothetical protein
MPFSGRIRVPPTRLGVRRRTKEKQRLLGSSLQLMNSQYTPSQKLHQNILSHLPESDTFETLAT